MFWSPGPRVGTGARGPPLCPLTVCGSRRRLLEIPFSSQLTLEILCSEAHLYSHKFCGDTSDVWRMPVRADLDPQDDSCLLELWFPPVPLNFPACSPEAPLSSQWSGPRWGLQLLPALLHGSCWGPSSRLPTLSEGRDGSIHIWRIQNPQEWRKCQCRSPLPASAILTECFTANLKYDIAPIDQHAT